jgi:hypothetical protein
LLSSIPIHLTSSQTIEGTQLQMNTQQFGHPTRFASYGQSPEQ